MKKKPANGKDLVIKAYLRQQCSKAIKLFPQAKSKLSEDKVYKLRVTLRRIRTVLQILDKNKFKTLDANEGKELSRIWKALGKHRDLDVAIHNAKAMGLDTALLEKACKAMQIRTEEKLTSKSIETVLRALKRIIRDINKKKINPSPAITRLIEELSGDFVSVHEIHHFRILLKKIRYLLESLNLDIAEFKPYQNVLGNFNDIDTLLALYGRDQELEVKRKKELKKAQALVPAARKLAIKKLKMVLSDFKAPSTVKIKS